MKEIIDVAIIGGGASGLTAAITAKRRSGGLRVCVFEALDRVGKKLITTGNGRCNITNRNPASNRFHGENPDFSRYALSKNAGAVTEEFFESLGIPFAYEGDKAYPASFQASSVVDCLRFECEKLGVEVLTSHRITNITLKSPFTISGDGFSHTAKTVICCTGLYSGGDKVGSDGGFFRLLKDKGFKTVKLSPSIVQLKTETDFVKQLKGIKTDALATLFCNGKKIKDEFGEVLFCDYGLSGPPILGISREAGRTDGKVFVSLDLFPTHSSEELKKLLESRVKILPGRSLEEFFTGMLNKRLGQVILKYCGLKLSDSVSVLGPQDIQNIATTLKDWHFKVMGNTGFLNSQVTAGGISTDEFSAKTLMSKRFGGLFACGELLDVDGDCGGFNLAWCWAGGILAAEEAVLYIGENYDNRKQRKTVTRHKF